MDDDVDEFGPLVVAGEALVDLFPAAGEPGSTLWSSWSAQSSGGPLNTAIAAARLGGRVAFVGRFGHDAFARQLLAHLRTNGVDTGWCVETDETTSLAVLSLQDGQASYDFHLAGTANVGWAPAELPALPDDAWLHTGSLAAILAPGARALRRWAAGTGANLSFDLNVRPAVLADPVAYWELVEPWLEVVGAVGGIVRGSDDDVAFLGRAVGFDGDAVEIASLWAAQYEPALVVVTLGAGGAVAIKPDGRVVHSPGRTPSPLADTVAAGDTFMAAFLQAYRARPHDLDDALRRANVAASLCCEHVGAEPPSAAELAAALAS